MMYGIQEEDSPYIGAFTLQIEGHTIEVNYNLKVFKTVAHFEFIGPISTTGYRSYFETYNDQLPPTWEQWIVMATEHALSLYKKHGLAYLNQANVGQQISLLSI